MSSINTIGGEAFTLPVTQFNAGVVGGELLARLARYQAQQRDKLRAMLQTPLFVDPPLPMTDLLLLVEEEG